MFSIHLASISVATVEGVIAVIAWHIPCTTHDVVDVLAKSGCIRPIYTGAETELIGSHKVLKRSDAV